MRITGGAWRSRRLFGPSKGMPLRPTPDALRERVFAVLGPRVADARVLDLYAGTGSIGLEALSRGARRAVFVEHHKAAARLVRRNIAQFEDAEAITRVVCRPARTAITELARRKDVFDIVWADPPFDRWQDGLEALVAASDAGLLETSGVACLECPAQADPTVIATPLEIIRDLDGGASRLLILEQSKGRPQRR